MSTDNYKYPGFDKSNSLSSKIEIKISCNLPKFDKFSNSDSKVLFLLKKRNLMIPMSAHIGS